MCQYFSIMYYSWKILLLVILEAVDLTSNKLLHYTVNFFFLSICLENDILLTTSTLFSVVFKYSSTVWIWNPHHDPRLTLEATCASTIRVEWKSFPNSWFQYPFCRGLRVSFLNVYPLLSRSKCTYEIIVVLLQSSFTENLTSVAK